MFNQYLRRTGIPALEIRPGEAPGTIAFRWDAAEPRFEMPVRVGAPGNWIKLLPTSSWQSFRTPFDVSDLQVATDLYFVDVRRE